ncbi:MAG TPA: phosphatidylserine decarboxylase [Ktedonobacterales bacterium]|nr:phosphatidylserine decarboxylase [Ktedonobacterales bacterium]
MQPAQSAASMLKRIEADTPALGALKEGLPAIGGALLAALIINRRFPRLGKLFWLASALLLFFFRDPPRPYPQDDQYIYAAADGTIMAVDRVQEDWFIGGPATRIVTFLSLLNVHINRSPVSGEIARQEWQPGTFVNAMHFEKSEANERNSIAINGQCGKVTVVQFAGMVARRIVCWAGEGETLRAGQKFGMIKFSSRTDVLAPDGAIEVLVKPGQQVRAGITPIARYMTAGDERQTIGTV